MAMFKPVTSWNEVPLILDPPFVARILGRTPDKIRRRCLTGEIPAYKDGKEWRILKDDLIKYIEDNKNKTLKGA